MQSVGVRPNFHARTALASTLGPSWPEVPSRDPDDDSSDESLSDEEQLEPYQQTEYQRAKTQRLVPAAPQLKPAGTGPIGFLAPPLKPNATRPPGGCYPPLIPMEPLPLRHPGEKPRYATDATPERLQGLGLFGTLTDSLVARLCSYVDRYDLLQLTATSRIFYQVGNWDSRVWKSHALRRWCGDFIFRTNWKISTFYSHKGCDLPPPQLVQLAKAQRSFPPVPTPQYAMAPQHCPDTLDKHLDNPYAQMHAAGLAASTDPLASAPQNTQNEANDGTTHAMAQPESLKDEMDKLKLNGKADALPTQETSSPATPPTEFLRIPGFFSEPMYKEWYLSQVDLDGWYHDTGHVPRIRASEITTEAFVDRFLKGGQPCVITDVVPTWPAMHKWHPDTLMDSYCETLIKINEYNDDELRIKMTMRDFLIYMRENQEARPLYVFDSSFQRRAPTLLQDYGIPRFFWEDLFAALDDHHRPAFRWFLFGCARTGSPFHQDPNGTSAWNAVTHGHKRWALYPPWMSQVPGSYPNGHQPNSLKWWSLIYPQLPPELKPMELVQGPGELIFIPSGWWHAVLNLDETVSVTQNFVNVQNLDAVCHSLFTSDMQGVMNYWRQRLLSLRPELYDYIGNRMAYETSIAQEDHIAQLQQDMEEKQAAFEKREAELLAEIERLSTSSGAKPMTSTALTARLVAAQKREKKKTSSHY